MTGVRFADTETASGSFRPLRITASCIPQTLTARIPKNNALLVTIFLISGFIHITSEVVLVKVYVREKRNMTVLETGEYIKQLFRIKICKQTQLQGASVFLVLYVGGLRLHALYSSCFTENSSRFPGIEKHLPSQVLRVYSVITGCLWNKRLSQIQAADRTAGRIFRRTMLSPEAASMFADSLATSEKAPPAI